MNDEKKKHIEKQSRPMKITNFFVNHPCISLAICLSVFVVSTILTIAFDWFSMSEQGDRDFHIWDNQKVKHKDMYDEAEDIFQEKTATQQVPLQTDKVWQWKTRVILECRDDDCSNVLTQKGINLMIKIEDKITKINRFNQFCLREENKGGCSQDVFISFSNLLRETYQNRDITNLASTELSNALNSVFYEDNYEQYSFLFHKDFKKSNQKSKLLMTEINFGAPIKVGSKTYKNKYDDFEDQNKEFKKYTKDLMLMVKDMNKDDNGGINILIHSEEISAQEFETISYRDMSFAGLSMIFVQVFLGIHLKSFFLSCMSMLGILMTFPMTFVLYKGILGVGYFSFMQILVIFIILGIAADDIFVLFDAWKQSEEYDFLEGDKQKRMAISFRRASKAMLATSFTTSVSFLANAFSPIMPIKSFGIFASILVPMNYAMVICYLPCLIIIQEQYFPSCMFWKKKNDNEENFIQNEKKESKVALILENQVNDFIFKARYFILAFTLAWIIAASILASKIGPLTEQEKFIPDSHKLARAENYMWNEMHTSRKNGGIYISLVIYWGTSDINYDGVDQWDSEFQGELLWDSKFTLSPMENQLYLYNFCNSIQRNKLFEKTKGEFECFILDFKEWLDTSGRSFPVQENQFEPTLVEFLKSPKGIPHYFTRNVGYFDNKLNFVGIKVPSIGDRTLGYESNEKLERKWQKYIDKQNEIAPEGLQNAKQQSMTWAWMVTRRELVESSIRGILISLAFALATLVVFTFNIIISLYSVITISGIIISVLAIMYMAGFAIGISESIAIVVLIGMSVDYVVHLANHYVESTHDDKYNRTKEALKEIGVSIISGGITTLGSGCMLFFAIITLFVKFAILIVATVSFSFFFSMIFFTALTHTIGPQGNQGHIIKMFKKQDKNKQYDDENNNSTQQSINIQ